MIDWSIGISEVESYYNNGIIWFGLHKHLYYPEACYIFNHEYIHAALHNVGETEANEKLDDVWMYDPTGNKEEMCDRTDRCYGFEQGVNCLYCDIFWENYENYRNTSRGGDLHPSLSEVKVCEKEKEVVE